MNKKVIYIIGFLLLIIISSVVIYVIKDKDEANEDNIIKYEIETHEYIDNGLEVSKYYIDSVEELNVFYEINLDDINVSEDVLKESSIFIQIEEAYSGNIVKLSSVTFDNNKVNFNIDKVSPEIATNGVSFWYLIAIIPKEELINLDIADWHKPTEVMKNMSEDLEVEDDYVFELNSNNKYVIITNFRWITMQNDGGSHTNIYYQIDLDNNIVLKVREGYEANLAGVPETEKKVIYVKEIDNNINKELASLINELMINEDVNDTNNYSFYTILSLNNEKNIYNENSISKINDCLQKIDNLEN